MAATSVGSGTSDPLTTARDVALRHHELLCARLGSDVVAVWLTGSAALDDLTARSDVDTVTVTARALSEGDHAHLREVHDMLREEHPGVRYDTTYLSRDQLTRPPQPDIAAPFSQDGDLHLGEACGEVHPVTWFCLPHALRVAGLAPTRVDVAVDSRAAVEHSRRNLEDYWRPTAASVLERTAERDPEETLPSGEIPVWLTLGAARLVMFVTSQPFRGPIPSKTEAGTWVAQIATKHAALARRALTDRASPPGASALAWTVGDARQAGRLVLTLAATAR